MNIADTEDLFVPGELVLNRCGTEAVGGISKNRTRRDFTLIYILKGRAYLTHNGVEQPVEEGQSMLFLPGCRQNYRFDSTTKNLNMWIHFAGSFCKILDGEGARIITVSSRSEWESNFHRLTRTYASLEEDRGLLSLAYLRVMIALLVRDEKAQHKAVSAKAQLHAIIGLIQSNLAYHNINWDECAARCCMSRSRFNHVFKEYVGMSPGKYHSHLRMERAKFLLGDFGLSVGECADTLGFQDVSYFCRRFRKEFGMSPSEYQKKF